MEIRVNGEIRALTQGSTLGALLSILEVSTEGVAIAVNRVVIARGQIEDRILKAGDVVEVVRAVGGG